MINGDTMRALLVEDARRPPSILDPLTAQSRRVPTDKAFDVWDEPLGDPGTDPRALRILGLVDRHENLVVCGLSGTGKTHFLEALDRACVDNGHKASWFATSTSAPSSAAAAPRHRRHRQQGDPSDHARLTSSTTSAYSP